MPGMCMKDADSKRVMQQSQACNSAHMQGRTYAPGDAADELAEAIREFNAFVRKDPRVNVVALPFRDGVSIITRR